MTKRLFIFAGYDKDGIVDPTLTHYLNALSKIGDIVFTMDNDASDTELQKVSDIPNVLYANAKRHGEYDFGSYKRGYMWAHNKILNKYDWVYFVNDSVIGPIFDLSKCMNDMESHGADMVGMVAYNGNDLLPHVQSWFVGLRRDIATAQFFQEFLQGVKHQDSKKLVVFSYEIRMTQLVLQHGYTYYSYSNAGSEIYDKPIKCIADGIPFIKKQSLGKILQTNNIYSCVDINMHAMILNYAQRNGFSKPIIQSSKPYNKVFRLTLFSIPIITIYRKAPFGNDSAYKVKLLDFIPLMKITRHKSVTDQYI